MLGWMRSDPDKKRQKAYEKKLHEAMLAQRRGDIKSYSMLTEEAEVLYREIKESRSA